MLSLDDYESEARKILPRPIFGYISGAAESGGSHRANISSFRSWDFVPRVLVDVSRRSQIAGLFGHDWDAPFGIAPMGIAAMTTYDGDMALARSASEKNIPFILSGVSLTPLESVLEAAPNTWFQAYLPGDMQRINGLLERCRRAEVKTLVITVDIPVPGNRENNVRSGFSMPLRPGFRLAWDGLTRPSWLIKTLFRTLINGVPHFENAYAERGAPIISVNATRDFSKRDHLSWHHISAIRDSWRGNLVLKGVLSAQDAVRARDVGADAIILSNHGGRQLDGSISPLEILPDVVRSVPNLPVMLDGGVRRGSDVLKAIALGAKFVFIGRPFNYAAAVAGFDGVSHAINLLMAEIDRNMAMLGVNGVRELSMEHVRRR